MANRVYQLLTFIFVVSLTISSNIVWSATAHHAKKSKKVSHQISQQTINKTHKHLHKHYQVHQVSKARKAAPQRTTQAGKKPVIKKQLATRPVIKNKKVLHHTAPAPIKHTPAPALTINHANLDVMSLPRYLLSTAEKKVVHFVRQAIANIRYNNYKLGGEKIDVNRGIYVVDCSRYVDYVLKNTYPSAFGSLKAWSGTATPTSYDYYQYFTNLSEDTTHWDVIEEVGELRPGDILVFRNKNRSASSTGHVMIVMDRPIKDGDAYLVRIADAAPTGHSEDTRIAHTSGIGIGTLLLKANPRTLKPRAYAWKVGAKWENNVKFAMARPRLGRIEAD